MNVLTQKSSLFRKKIETVSGLEAGSGSAIRYTAVPKMLKICDTWQ
jgi:hypothetical protein